VEYGKWLMPVDGLCLIGLGGNLLQSAENAFLSIFSRDCINRIFLALKRKLPRQADTSKVELLT